MKFSALSILAAALLPAAMAAPVIDANQSPNPHNARQVQIWVWACDGENFTGNCGAVQDVNLGSCYTFSSLFPGIGNGSFKTNGNVFFFDGGGCTGTASGRVCDVETWSHDDYWYDHTVSFNVFSTMAECDS